MTLHEMQVYQQQADTGAVRKAVRGAAIGNTVEWFDFAI
jgi:MFS transporter, MHS family, proline/betaine transporter